MELEILKKNYNKVLARYKKAEEFFNNTDSEKADRWLPEFQKIIIKLSSMMKKYTQLTGKEMTNDEAVNGFK